MILRIILLIALVWISSVFSNLWYVFAFPCAIMGFFFSVNAKEAFFASFLAVLVLWLSRMLVLNAMGGDAFVERIAGLFMLPNGLTLILVTASIGALLAGLSGLSGYHLKRYVIKDAKGNGAPTFPANPL